MWAPAPKWAELIWIQRVQKVSMRSNQLWPLLRWEPRTNSSAAVLPSFSFLPVLLYLLTSDVKSFIVVRAADLATRQYQSVSPVLSIFPDNYAILPYSVRHLAYGRIFLLLVLETEVSRVGCHLNTFRNSHLNPNVPRNRQLFFNWRLHRVSGKGDIHFSGGTA